MEGQRRMFDKEFKQRTVELILSGEKKAIKATEELGIDKGNVYRWIKEYKQDRRDTFPGNGKLKPEDEELRKFKRQLADGRCLFIWIIYPLLNFGDLTLT